MVSEPPPSGLKVLASVRAASATLPPALARIARTVLDTPDRILSATVTELAELSTTSEASVIRFCHEQGFASYQGFKLALATELAMSAPPSQAAGQWAEIAERAVIALRETQELLLPAAVVTVADRLIASGRTLLFGVGASTITARYAAYKLTRLGLPAVAHDDPHMAAMAAATLSGTDVAVAVSSSGSSVDTVKAAGRARETGAFVVALTNRTRSPLSALADVTLVAASAETPLTGGAFVSKISQLLIVDIVSETIARRHSPAQAAIGLTARSVADRGY